MISTCRCRSDELDPYKACAHPEIEYEGAVLAKGEHNHYDDSDFYAVVWDEKQQRVREVEYASTRGWTYHNRATIDATEEVHAKALAWYRERWLELAIAHAHGETRAIKVGRTVRVTRGKYKGAEGEVCWYGKDRYRSNRWATHYRVGVKLMKDYVSDSELTFMSAENVEVARPAPVDEHAIREQAQRVTVSGWAGAVTGLAYQAVRSM